MKKIAFLIIFLIINAYAAEPNPFSDNAYETNNNAFNDDNDFLDDNENITNKMIYLNAIQKNFWSKDRKKSDNTININYKSGETHMIRTRINMTTTFVFDNDKIAFITLGDGVGFEIQEVKNNKFDLSNILIIKPNLIGIDTNLTVIGESGNIYQFYIFSTDHKNTRNPAFVVFISENREINKINIKNPENNKSNEYIEKPIESIESENDEEIIIGSKVNKLSIAKNEIKRGYSQKPRTNTFGQKSPEAVKLMAQDIFNDKKWTYFKFDKNLATSKFPAVFRVVDGYDNPMNSRVVGNYLIVETIADKWTLRIGNEWVCVRREE